MRISILAAAIIAAVILVLVVVVAIMAMVFFSERRKARRVVQAALRKDVPAFGIPRRVQYLRENFEGPLRCSGAACGHRFILDEEWFYDIPIVNSTDGAMIAVCIPCSTIATQIKLARS